MGREPWSLRDPGRFTARPTIRLAYPLIIGFFAAKIARHGTPARLGPELGPSAGRTDRTAHQGEEAADGLVGTGRDSPPSAERRPPSTEQSENPIIRRTLASRARRPPINWGVHAWLQFRADRTPAVTRRPFPGRRISRGERADPSLLGRPLAKRVIAKARRLRVLVPAPAWFSRVHHRPKSLPAFASARPHDRLAIRSGAVSPSGLGESRLFSGARPPGSGRPVTRPLTRSRSWNDRHPST